MNPFFVEDMFFSDVNEYLDYVEMEKEDVEALPADYTLSIMECELEPMFKLDESNLAEMLVSQYEERCSEDGDEYAKIQKALSECVDFKKLNELIPRLWYPQDKEAQLTKQDLLNYL